MHSKTNIYPLSFQMDIQAYFRVNADSAKGEVVIYLKMMYINSKISIA